MFSGAGASGGLRVRLSEALGPLRGSFVGVRRATSNTNSAVDPYFRMENAIPGIPIPHVKALIRFPDPQTSHRGQAQCYAISAPCWQTPKLAVMAETLLAAVELAQGRR